MIADLTCLAINASCIDPNTWEFLAVAFGDQGLLPGASYIANIHSSTGPTESLATVIQNIQSKLEINCPSARFRKKTQKSSPFFGSLNGIKVGVNYENCKSHEKHKLSKRKNLWR